MTRVPDSVAVIAYFQSSPFTNTAATSRYSYYGAPGTPDVRLDGIQDVLGGISNGTMYPVYRDYFDTRKTVVSPLDIGLSVAYDTVARTGTLTANLKNTSSGAVSGQLQVAIVERSVYYPWSGGDSVFSVERAMLPDASGEAVSIPAGDSLTKTRNFSMTSGWADRNCDFVVFVQNNSSKEIYQGAREAIRPVPVLAYTGYEPTALPIPGADVQLAIHLRNTGFAGASGVTAILSTSDPNITVTTAGANYGDIPRHGEAVPVASFQIHVESGCPDPHLATFDLAITAADGYSASASFPLNVATVPGLADNMESGDNNWTHSGTSDHWHQSTYRSVSPTHAWYSGSDASHQYTNENDARLLTPYFTFGAGATLSFQNWYATEPGFDYCLVEVDNGSGFWFPVASFTGSGGGTWHAQSYPLDAFANQTIRARFRFLSDYNVTAEGWYIDDFNAGVTGVAEENRPVRFGFSLSRNPVIGRAEIAYQLPVAERASLDIYDASGRIVSHVANGLSGVGRAFWNLIDDSGQPVQAGMYFARLSSDSRQTVTKLVVAR